MIDLLKRTDSTTLSYARLRQCVGLVALFLPFALALPWALWGQPAPGHPVLDSISAYYYTGMRDLFVGSLCAISMFMLACRGYDLGDEIAGVASGICALGVAFFPCDCGTLPPCVANDFFANTKVIHYIFAGLLFTILAIFCLFLFTRTGPAGKEARTPRKAQRNVVYVVCGWAIVVSILVIGASNFLLPPYTILGFAPNFFFETTSLLAFGLAWLVKGETFLKDKP